MVLDDLKKLPDEQVIEIVRKRLMELKKEKSGTSAFRNDELDMTWSAVTDYLRDIGYKMIDQKTYEIARFQRKGEVIISAKEYEKLQKMRYWGWEIMWHILNMGMSDAMSVL